jgi:hypothetical protein
VPKCKAESSPVKHVGGHDELLAVDVRQVEEPEVGEEELQEVGEVEANALRIAGGAGRPGTNVIILKIFPLAFFNSKYC